MQTAGNARGMAAMHHASRGAAPLASRPAGLAHRGGLRLGSAGAGAARRVGARVAFTDRTGNMDYGNNFYGSDLQKLLASLNIQTGYPVDGVSGQDLASELFSTLRAQNEAAYRLEEQEAVAKLQLELEAARSEVEVLQGEAAASAALRDELSARTAALATARDNLLRMEEQRTEELHASLARFAELEEALALAEESIQGVVDESVAQALEARVLELEGELRSAAGLASRLTDQLMQAQQARDQAQHAQREALAAAERAQQEASALARQLSEQRGELAYQTHSEGEGNGSQHALRAEVAAQQQEAAALQAALQLMREQVDSLRSAAAKGGPEAALHRTRALKLQTQLSRHQAKADAAAQHLRELEAELERSFLQTQASAVATATAAPQLNSKRDAVMAKAQLRLEQLEHAVRRAMNDCDNATSALAEALRGQHDAEQAQAAATRQLNLQLQRVSSLEEALQEQIKAASVAAEREQQLEGLLGQQAQRADLAEERASMLEGRVQDLSGEVAAARQAALGMEGEVASLSALQQELRAQLEEERERYSTLEGELSLLRREYDRAESELQALAMQAQRAAQQAERNNNQLAGAKDELAAVQAQLEAALAELETLRASDQQKAAQLASAAQAEQALRSEIERLTSALAEKDSLMQHWQREAELATELAQAAVLRQEEALSTVAQLQSALAQKEQERQVVGASPEDASLLRAQLAASHAQVQALREELAAARSKVLSAERLNEELQEQNEMEVAAFQDVLAATEAAAQKMAQQFLALSREKEAIAATALARSEGRVVVHTMKIKEDFITEAEVEGLLDEMDMLRAELAEAVKIAEESTLKSQQAEAHVAELQSQLNAAVARAQAAESQVASLRGQLAELMAAEDERRSTDVGVGRRMRELMQDLSVAKAAAREAQAQADKLAKEKSALLKELAFGPSGVVANNNVPATNLRFPSFPGAAATASNIKSLANQIKRLPIKIK